MGVSRTKTVKNKHATKGSGIANSKASRSGPVDGIVKAKKNGPPKSSKPQGKGALAALQAKRKKKVYAEKDLDIPKLNMVTPIGVEKPKGKKKGKVFVDDRVRPFHALSPGNAFKVSYTDFLRTGEHDHDPRTGPGR